MYDLLLTADLSGYNALLCEVYGIGTFKKIIYGHLQVGYYVHRKHFKERTCCWKASGGITTWNTFCFKTIFNTRVTSVFSISVNCLLYKMSYQWNVLSIVYLWNVWSMKCLVYCLFIKCPIHDMSCLLFIYEMSDPWQVLSIVYL